MFNVVHKYQSVSLLVLLTIAVDATGVFYTQSTLPTRLTQLTQTEEAFKYPLPQEKSVAQVGCPSASKISGCEPESIFSDVLQKVDDRGDRTDVLTPNRQWERVEHGFRAKLQAMLSELSQNGYDFQLIEGYRSSERQQYLFEQPQRVTWAKPRQSRHQYGLAADFLPVRSSELGLDIRQPWVQDAYEALGAAAERHGLVWGGRWTLRDWGHVEEAS